MQGYALSESHYINTMQGIATIKNQNKQTIFEKINQTIFGFFQEKIFEPLDLTFTSFAATDPVPLGTIRGYVDLKAGLLTSKVTLILDV